MKIIMGWYSINKGEQLHSSYTSSSKFRSKLNSTSYAPTNSSLLVMSSSFDIEFYELYWSIFIPNPLIATDPDLDVISCGGRQSYIDPWWRVEGATVAIGTTPLPIP